MPHRWDDQPKCSVCKGRGRIASYDLKGFRGYVACGNCHGSGIEPKRDGCMGCLLLLMGALALSAFLTGHQSVGGLIIVIGLVLMLFDS